MATHTHQHDHRHHPHDRDLITAADLHAGAAIPIRLRMNVTIRPDDQPHDATATAHHTPAHGHHDPANSPARRHHHDPVLESRLRQHGPRLMQWAKRTPANARTLLLDPLAAIRQAGVKLSPAERSALRKRLEGAASQNVLPAGVELVGLDVTFGRREATPPARPVKQSHEARRSKRRGRTGRGRRS